MEEDHKNEGYRSIVLVTRKNIRKNKRMKERRKEKSKEKLALFLFCQWNISIEKIFLK